MSPDWRVATHKREKMDGWINRSMDKHSISSQFASNLLTFSQHGIFQVRIPTVYQCSYINGPRTTTNTPVELFPRAANLRNHNTTWCNYQLHPNVNSNLRALILQYSPQISHCCNSLPTLCEFFAVTVLIILEVRQDFVISHFGKEYRVYGVLLIII